MTGTIACLVRGGEAGRKVQERAIELAAEHEKTILFAHVIDITPSDGQNERTIAAVETESKWLGNVILNMACRRAKLNGIGAEGIILYGSVFQAVVSHLSNHPADLILIGSPHPDQSDFEERMQKVHQFAVKLGQALEIPVEVVQP